MERKSFLLRMDPALYAEIERWAQQELRSVNGQIEFLLRDAVRRREQPRPNSSGVTPADPSAPVLPQDPGVPDAPWSPTTCHQPAQRWLA